MKRPIPLLLIVLLPGLALITPSAFADIYTYTYTGNPYNYILNAYPDPYTASMFVSETLDLASPLGSNCDPCVVFPVAWSVSDGVVTLSSAQPGNVSYFEFYTDPSSQIVAWETIAITHRAPAADLPYPSTLIESAWGPGPPSLISEDYSETWLPDGYNYVEAQDGSAGTWSFGSNTVPEPTYFSLVAIGLAGMVTRLLKRKS